MEFKTPKTYGEETKETIALRSQEESGGEYRTEVGYKVKSEYKQESEYK